jgi:hypothetical protein
VNQVHDIAIAVAEKNQPVALNSGGLGEKLNAAFAQLFGGGVEVIHTDCQVTNARIFHFLRRAIPLRWNELQQRPVLGACEIIAAVSVIDVKIQILHVPFGQALGVGRGNGGVLQSLKHKPGLYQSALGNYWNNCGANWFRYSRQLVQVWAPALS